MSYDLFLSYNHSDRESVEKLRQILDARGLSSFIDNRSLDLGLPWPQTLEQLLRSVRAVLVFVGPAMGFWQKREMYFALELQAEREREGDLFPVVPILLPGADLASGFLFLNTWVDLRDDRTSADAIDRLVKAISGEQVSEADKPVAQVTPYRELRAFDEDHSAFFFGREELSRHLLEKVCSQKGLVVVVGSSGSGKSSLVQAGLLPLLRRQRPPANTWDAICCKPDGDPFNRLARELIPLLLPEMPETRRLEELPILEEGLRSGKSRLEDSVASILKNSKGTDRLLIIIDQFEELITLRSKGAENPDGDDSVSFIKMMMAVSPRAPVEFVVTLRADFYGEVIGLNREMSDRFEQCHVNIGALKLAELENAIVKPAKKVGLDFEKGLVQRLLNDVGNEPGQLPLLQFALWALWDRRKSRLMTHAAYDEFGGVAKAINSVAHEKLEFLKKEEPKSEELVQRVFTRLVRLTHRDEGGETRRRASLDEFDNAERRLIDQFAEWRLLVTNRDPNTKEESVEVSHEALIREWDDLKRWLNDNREFLLWRQRLTYSLAEWRRLNADESALLRGPLLTEAEVWQRKREPDLNEEEREFIGSSRQRLQKEMLESEERRKRQLRNRILAFVTIAIAATVAIIQGDRAAGARKIAQARSLLSRAVLITNNAPAKFDQAALLAIESLRLDETPEAQSVLREAIAVLPKEIVRVRIDCDGEASLSPRGKYVVCLSKTRRSVKLISVASGRDEKDPLTEEEQISMAAASPDGQFVAVGLRSGGYKLYKLFDNRKKTLEAQLTPSVEEKTDPNDVRDALVGFSEDGKSFAAGVISKNMSTIHVVELSHSQHRTPFEIGFPIFALTFTPDADFLAVSHAGQAETGVTIFDLTTKKKPTTIRGGGDFSAMALSKGASVVAMPTLDHSVLVKNRAGTVIGELKHQQDVNTVALTQDGMYVASGSEDGTARVMEIQGRLVALIPAGSPVQSITFTEANNLVVLSGDTVRTVSVLNRPAFESLKLNGANSISPRGRYVTAVDTRSKEYIEVLDRMTPDAEPLKLSFRDLAMAATDIDSISYSDDEKHLLINSRSGLLSYSLVKPEPGPMQPAPPEWILTAISGDGQKVAWATTNDIQISRRGEPKSTLPLPNTRVLNLNSDGTLIAVSGAESVLTVYDVLNPQRPKFNPSGIAQVVKAEFSPEGRYLAVASDDKMLSLVEANTGTILWRLATDTILLSFSGDGNMLVAGGGTESQQAHDLSVIESRTGQTIRISQRTRPLGVAFDADGRYLEVLDLTAVTRHYLRTDDLIKQTCELLIPRSAQQWKITIPNGASAKTCPGLQ